MRDWRVGIVGAGPGGLMTAYSLQKLANCPVRITLFEATHRVGGKILTSHFRNSTVQYEAGAAEFYDYSQFDDDPLKDLVAELGLSTSPMAGSAVIMNDRILSNLDDIRDQLGVQAHKSVLEFDRLARDRMTREEFYDSDNPDGARPEPDRRRFDSILADVVEPEARQYIENLIHSDLATEPSQTSQPYGLQNYLMNNPEYMHLYSIEGGNERLIHELAARIDATVLLNHQVHRVVNVGHNRYRIDSIQDAKARQDEFDFVVIALPHNQLSSVTFAGDRLAEAVQQHKARFDYPAHYLRITILFDRPFWRDAITESYWMLDRFGGCCLYDESARVLGSTHGVLGWLLGGTAALEMNRLSDDQLIAEALDSLPDFLNQGRQHFVEGHVHRWIGAVNAIPGGIASINLDRRHQPEPIETPNLFMVGDYLFDSTINGVLDSANYVAAWLAAQITDN